MKKVLTGLLIFLTFFLGITLFISKSSKQPSIIKIDHGNTDQNIESRQKIKLKESTLLRRQKIDERIYQKYIGNTLFQKKLYEQGIYNPNYAELHNDTVYIADKSELKIKMFDTQGQLVGTVGRGSGKGPGEFVAIYDMAVSGDTIFVSDQSQMKVSFFNKNGSLLGEYKIKNVSKIIPVNDNIFYMSIFDDFFLNEYNVKDASIKPIALNIVEKQTSILNTLDGFLTKDEHNNIYASFLYCGFLASIDKKGNLNYLKETINAPAYLPEIVVYNTGGGTRMVRSDYVVSISLTYYENNLYTIGGRIIEKKATENDSKTYDTVIDVYSANNGSYKESFVLEGEIRNIMLNDKFIFTIDKDGIFKKFERI